MMNNQTPQYGQIPYSNGMQYAGQAPRVQRANPLTKEEIASLKQNHSAFSLQMTHEEMMRGICFHVNEDGTPATITQPDGTTRCTVCGKVWNSNELTEEQVQEATNNLLSVLQTIKLLYINFPDQAAREFYQIIPLIEKVPQLYKIAVDNFRTYEGNFNGYFGNQPNPFMLFGQIMGGNGFQNAFQYQQTQPMYGQPMYGQPVMPAYGQPMAPYGQPAYSQQPVNPFDSQSQMYSQGYQPATPQGYAYQPGQPVAPVAPPAAPAQPAPAAPTAPAEVTTSGNHTP